VDVAGVIPLVPAWRVDRAFDYAVPPELSGAVVAGSLVRVPFGARRVRGVVVSITRNGAPDRTLEAILSVVAPAPVAPPPLDRILDWLSRRYVAPRGRAFALAVPPRVRVQSRPPIALDGGPRPRRILDYHGGPALVEAIERGRSGVWCVQSLPGEDRAALIGELVAAAGGSAGGAALVAVPEVRYGSAVLDALAVHWPELARVDSAQPDMERASSWVRLSEGHGVGAGGRAAVLAPGPRLRLLIVDEEHHPSYKEDRAPRYDAVRVAVERARLQGAVCALISAAPSIPLGAAAAAGEIGWVRPPRAAAKRRRPIVELLEHPRTGALSRELHIRVRDALRAGKRVGLLAPSRGYARAVWCAACRRSLRCSICESGLFYNRPARTVRCASCGFRGPAPDTCPACSSSDWRLVGAGSERLAEQLTAMFPRANVVRVDPDVLAGRMDGAPRLDGADIYLTTWIGTKPALRPDVSLVGVIDADALIRRPDWRSAERAYQALVELAEWAGPAERGGRLLVQTSEPRHHAVQAVVRADYSFFLERELGSRRELLYPPYSELIKVSVSGPGGDAVMAALRRAVEDVHARMLGPMSVRSPGRADPTREVLLKCTSADALSDALKEIVVDAPRGTAVRVDTDPR
jgi:primosomal protein N' (replication factor Y)